MYCFDFVKFPTTPPQQFKLNKEKVRDIAVFCPFYLINNTFFYVENKF